MKRLVWLFLAVFCTALAQVQRVELPVPPQKTCSCCDEPGTCGMPECGLPPAAMPSVYATERPVTVARPAASPEATRVHLAMREFLAAFLSKPTARQLSPARLVETFPPSQVPLFKAHCAFLI
jgi:hypothetical protein